MIRSRFVPVILLAVVALLALAASAGAKPHKSKGGGSDLAVNAPKGAKLTVGTATKLKVSVADRGHGALVGVVLQAKASKGVTVRPAKVKVGRLKAGKREVATFKVTATSTAKPKLVFVATAPGEPKAKDAVAVKIAGGSNGPKEEAKKAPDIVGRYFWNTYQVLTTTYMHAYYFVDEHWVYRGVPKEGLPSCTSQTANGEEDGCLPYTWDETTGALNIGGTTGEYKIGSHGAKIGEESFSEALPAEAGAKFDASGSYINEFGLCPLSCSFVTVDLKMSSSGEFARASGVSGFFGEGGSYGALPPEDHGTYSIEPRGRITFSYADGHVVTDTIAVMLNSGDAPDANYGLLLGESAYFGPDSEVGT
ncbi:MAG TPA: hypothetical protein VJ204_19570 [Solirubrobacterales bacterium]|nr:hypothetical protein [Solirubrobacterales bacterium]